MKQLPTRRGLAYLYDQKPALADMREEVLGGLQSRPRVLPPKYFYDATGSWLFEAITALPEYYPTRTEIALLRRHGREIRDCVGPSCMLIEYGSGANTKIRLLLEAVRPAAYVPLDISHEQLARAAADLAEDYPWLEVHAACVDYSRDISLPQGVAETGHRVAFFPGSSIGNFEPHEAEAFLRRVHRLVGEPGGLLLGVDLVKPRQVLEAAYNDRQGVTAAFNRNLLAHIGGRLGGNLDARQFDHRAAYNGQRQRIEMYLHSRLDQVFTLAGERFALRAGESIRTEHSYKYTPQQVATLAARGGFSVQRQWIDAKGFFGIFYLQSADRFIK